MKAIKIFDETIFVGMAAYTNIKSSSVKEFVLNPKKKPENAKPEDWEETETPTIEFSGSNVDFKVIKFKSIKQRDEIVTQIDELLETTDLTSKK